jgi:hypothetical protein
MQSYAACSDPDIQARVRDCYVELVHEVRELTGADAPRLWSFFSAGMLLNVVASLDLEVVAGEEDWAACWIAPDQLPSMDPPSPGQ